MIVVIGEALKKPKHVCVLLALVVVAQVIRRSESFDIPGMKVLVTEKTQ